MFADIFKLARVIADAIARLARGREMPPPAPAQDAIDARIDAELADRRTREEADALYAEVERAAAEPVTRPLGGMTVGGRSMTPEEVAARAAPVIEEREPAAPVPVDWPSTPDYVPMTDSERAAAFGLMRYAPRADGTVTILDDWAAEHLVTVEIPQLRGIVGAPPSCRITFHRAGASAIVALWQAWEDAGILGDVLQFSGAWNPRMVRGSATVLSNHAYATALDINAGFNPMGHDGAAMGAPGDMRRLTAVAVALGWESGRYFARRDPMHLQLGRGAIG